MHALQMLLESGMSEERSVLRIPRDRLRQRRLGGGALLQVGDGLLTIAERESRPREQLGWDVLLRGGRLQLGKEPLRFLPTTEFDERDHLAPKGSSRLSASPF